jgi:hypothetical protein
MTTNDSAAAPQRRSWKQPHKAAHLKVEMQRTKRFLVVLFGGLALVGFILLLLYWFWPHAKLQVITLSATDYDPLEAPPIPYAAEDLGALQVLDPKLKSHSGGNVVADRIASLGDVLQSTAGTKDNLLVYVSAHGIHKSEGKDGATARLLLSDSDYRHNRGWVPLKQLLEAVSRSRASTKLLVIDWGQLETDPRMGVLVNEFPLRLEEEVRNIPDPNLWVLTSHSLLERSHVSHEDRRSVFAYFLTKGLKGRADGFVDKGVDDRVHLNELAGYVRHHVSQTVWRDSKNKETQTPQLFRGKTGLVDSTVAQEVFLARSRPPEEQQEPARPTTSPTPAPASDKPVAATASPAPSASALTPPTTAVSAAPAVSATGTADAAASASPGASSAAGAGTAAGTGPIAAGSATPSATAGIASTATNPAPISPAPSVAAAAAPPVDPRLDAALKESWQEIVRREGGADEQLWTPIDFAPHLWRRYQELLRGYQDRVELRSTSTSKISRAELDGNKQKLLEEIQAAQERFELSTAKRSYEEHKLKSIVRLRNRIVFRAFDLVRVRDLDGTPRPHAPRLTDQQAVAIARVLDELRNSLLKELAKPLTTPTLAEARGGTEQNDWLQALGDDEERLRDLFKALETDMQAVARIEKPKIGPLGEILDATKPSGTAEADRWKEARERARVECIMALLGEGAEQGADLQSSITLLNRTTGGAAADVVVFRMLGDRLADFYAAIPDRVGKLREAKRSLDLWNAEMLTRVAVADDALTNEIRPSLVSGLPNPLTDWNLLAVHRQFTFRGPGETAASTEESSPARLDLGQPVALGWTLSSNQSLPQQMSVVVEFTENLLEVFDGQRKIDSGRPFAISAGPGAISTDIRLLVRARTARKDPANLTLTVDAGEAGKFKKQVRCEFPTLTQIEVRVYDAVTGKPIGATNPTVPYDRVTAADGTPLNVLRLRPFPVGAKKTTDYSLRLREASGRELKDVTVKLFAVPPPPDGGAKWNFDAKRFTDPLLPLPSWMKLSETTASLPAASAEIPYPLKSPVAAAPNDGAAAAPNPAPAGMSVNGGLVCVLEFTEPGGTLRRESVWLDVDPRHPETYVRPEVTAKVDQSQGGKVGVEVIVRLQEGIEIPEAGFEIAMNTTLPAGENLPNKVDFAKITKLTREARLFMPVSGDATKTFDLWLDVDGYPRAFAYEDVSCTTRRNFKRTLEPKRALEFNRLTGWKKNPPPPAAPDDKSTNEVNPMETSDGKRLFSFVEAIVVNFRADAHPLADERYRIQIGLKGRSDLKTFYSDRLSDVTLMPVETGALRLESKINDLEAVLDMRGISESEAEIRADIKRVDSIGDYYPFKDLPIRIDSRPPKIVSAGGTSLFALENDKLTVRVTVEDDSPVVGVDMVFTNRKGEFKDPKPAQTLSAAGGDYQFTFDLKDQPVGTNYFVLVRAKDAVGNVNDIPFEIPVTIGMRPAAMKPNAADGTPVKNGSIAGTVRQGMTPREGVELKLDKLNRTARTGPDGRFRFTDLPPDQYEITATYSAGGQTFTAMPQIISVISDKEATVSLGLK